jgi:hypothetical protein
MSAGSSLTPEQRRLRASVAAHERWAHNDPVEGTKPARTAWFGKFIEQVDHDRKLPEAERQRRAQSAMRAHMQRMALRSSRARSKAAK